MEPAPARFHSPVSILRHPPRPYSLTKQKQINAEASTNGDTEYTLSTTPKTSPSTYGTPCSSTYGTPQSSIYGSPHSSTSPTTFAAIYETPRTRSPTVSIATKLPATISVTSDGDVFTSAGSISAGDRAGGKIGLGREDGTYRLRVPGGLHYQDESSARHAMQVRAWERERTCEMVEEPIRAFGTKRTRQPGYITAADLESPSRQTRLRAYGLGDIGSGSSGAFELERLSLELGRDSVGRMGMVRVGSGGTGRLSSEFGQSLGRMGMVLPGNGGVERLSSEVGQSIGRMGMVRAGSGDLKRLSSDLGGDSVGRMGMVLAGSGDLERLSSELGKDSVGRMRMVLVGSGALGLSSELGRDSVGRMGMVHAGSNSVGRLSSELGRDSVGRMGMVRAGV